MSLIIHLLTADARRIFRDRMMWIFLLLPFMLIPILRWGVPWIGTYWPPLRAYDALSTGLISLTITVSPAMLAALLMLDEKDLNMFDSLRVLPISIRTFLIYRLGLITFFGGLAGMISLILAGLQGYSLSEILLTSVLMALFAPLVPLVIVAVAQNKIEGVSLLKAVNIAMGFPVMVILLAPSWEWISGLLPFYWLFKILMSIQANEAFLLYWFLGIGITIGFNILFFRLFKQRVFHRA